MKPTAVSWHLAAAVVVLNLPRLVLGSLWGLQRNDVADHYVDKFMHCAAWVRAPAEHLWNPWQLRGWPTLAGSVNPQHFGCLVAAVAPIEYVFPILQTTVELLAVVGAYLFARHTAGLEPRPAVYAALVHLVIYSLHNENPFVTQVVLLPLLVFLTSSGARAVPRAVRVVGLLLTTLLSFPLYAVPLMPVAHVVVALIAGRDRRRDVLGAVLFWAGFAIFYLPNFMQYAQLAPHSNRAFFHTGFETSTPASLLPIMLVKALAYPAFVVVLAQARGGRAALLAAGFGVLVAMQTSVQQSTTWAALATQYPALLAFVPRTVYFASTAVFLAVIVALREPPGAWSRRTRLLAVLAFSVGLGAVLAVTWSPLRGIGGAIVAAWIGALLVSDILRRPALPLTAAALVFLLPAHALAVVASEAFPYGHLFAVRDVVPRDGVARVATVTGGCHPHLMYPAQATVAGHETFDGFSVYHGKAFAERWWWYVTRDSTGCSREFYHWSNRVELIAEDLERSPDRVLGWLRVNNVGWLRSEMALSHPDLTLVRETTVPRNAARASLCAIARGLSMDAGCRLVWGSSSCRACADADGAGCAACRLPRYTYRLERSFARAFVLPDPPAGMIALEDEERLLRALDAAPVRMVSLGTRRPGRIEFEGAFEPGALIMVSENAVPGWRISIDGVAAAPGPPLFGMLSVRTAPGSHRYVVTFEDGTLPWVAWSAVLGLAVMIAVAMVGHEPLPRNRLDRLQSG